MSADVTAWDTETHLIGRGMGAPRMVCLSLANGEGTRLFNREQGLDIIEKRLLPQRTVGHHIFYDLGVAAAERKQLLYPIFKALDEGRLEDTKLRQMMIDNALGQLKYEWDDEKEEWKKQNYRLETLVYRHLGYDIAFKKKGDDIWRLRYNELDGVPLDQWPEEARTYAIDDSVLTLEIRNRQQAMVEPEGIPREETQSQAAWGLHLMSLWGVRTEGAAVEKLKTQIFADYKVQAQICTEHGFMRGASDKGKTGSKNLKKIRAAIEKWYQDHPDKDMKITPKGAIATSREQLMTTDHPGLRAVAEATKVGKLKTTYIPALERGTVVPITASYNTILETFRTSCSGGMKIDGVPVGINLQNLPRGDAVRDCFVARFGFVFIFCDFDTLEMRTLAQVCIDLFGFSVIAESIKAGRDLHVDLAAEMLGMTYDQAWALHIAGDPKMAEARQGCKIGNYGFAGGMGWRTFIAYAKGFGVTITPELAQRLHKNFRKKWREMVDYFNYCSFLCKEGDNHGRAKQIEFVRSGMMRGDVGYTATCNGFFQHLAAMGAKEAVYRVSKECYVDAGSPLHGTRPWLFAHDEIGAETPIGAIGPRGAHEAAMRLQQVMKEAMEYWCPDVDIGATVTMARRWYKGAKPVYKNGLLVPCKPVKKGKKTVWVEDV
jgi:hypothetical protein